MFGIAQCVEDGLVKPDILLPDDPGFAGCLGLLGRRWRRDQFPEVQKLLRVQPPKLRPQFRRRKFLERFW